MSIVDLYIDYGIETASEGHKHFRDGWENIPCPHCSGSEGYHLGFNTSGSYFFCWRCGPHFIDQTLIKLLKISYPQADVIIREYKLKKKSSKSSTERIIKLNRKPFKYPSSVGKMEKQHRRYLEKRNFDPEEIEKVWGIKGTGPSSMLDGIFYKYRILYPIHWENEIVSFQTRDYTEKQKLKYLTCPEEREIVHHKNILYGKQFESKIGIVVEGAFDVWRLGKYAVATLGTGYTGDQMRLIAKLYQKVFIIFDPEPQAIERAYKLKEQLEFRNVDTYVYEDLETDPADLSQSDANHLIKELGLVPGGSSSF